MIRQDELHQYHKTILKLQDRIAPFTPSIREIADECGLVSTSTTSYILNRLVKMGLCLTRKADKGKFTRYYAVKATE